MSWQCSATYFSALCTAAQQLGHLPQVRARVDLVTRETLDSAHRQAWWPGDRLVSFITALEEVGGAGTARAVGITASHDGMGKLVRPLTSVLLAFSRSPLESLLSRLGTFANLGLRGIDARWQKEAAGRGTAAFAFPEPVPPLVAEQWHGLFSVGISLARQGAVREVIVEPTVHRFVIEWS